MPLGMESGLIPDRAITASSEDSFLFRAANGRLHQRLTEAWLAKYLDEHQWLQVFLGPYYIINKIATQGRSRSFQFVLSYLLEYSEDGNHFVYYKDTSNEVR